MDYESLLGFLIEYKILGIILIALGIWLCVSFKKTETGQEPHTGRFITRITVDKSRFFIGVALIIFGVWSLFV